MSRNVFDINRISRARTEHTHVSAARIDFFPSKRSLEEQSCVSWFFLYIPVERIQNNHRGRGVDAFNLRRIYPTYSCRISSFNNALATAWWYISARMHTPPPPPVRHGREFETWSRVLPDQHHHHVVYTNIATTQGALLSQSNRIRCSRATIYITRPSIFFPPAENDRASLFFFLTTQSIPAAGEEKRGEAIRNIIVKDVAGLRSPKSLGSLEELYRQYCYLSPWAWLSLSNAFIRIFSLL